MRPSHHRRCRAAMLLTLFLCAAGRGARAQILVNGMMIQGGNVPPGLMMDNEDWDDGPDVQMLGEDAVQARLRQQISQIMQNPNSPPKADIWQRNASIENGLVALGSAALPALQAQAAACTGMELDAVQVAAFRIQNTPFDPRQTLTDWAQNHFHYVPDPQAPFRPLPLKLARILSISPGDLLFPHHLFYVIEWLPAHARIPVAIAADGKVDVLSDDAAIAHFLFVEVPPQKTQAGRELLADAALLLAIARTTDLSTRQVPHTESHDRAASATLEQGTLHQNATLTFTSAGTVESVKTEPAPVPQPPAN